MPFKFEKKVLAARLHAFGRKIDPEKRWLREEPLTYDVISVPSTEGESRA